jgi:3-methyladenine DNA glycosylase AlkD
MTAKEVIQYMESLRNEKQRIGLMRFFKTGKGEYGEGDEFLGLKVPETREVVKYAKDVPFEEIPEMLTNHYHEIRLCGFLLLVKRFEELATKKKIYDEAAIERRDTIVKMYLEYADYANNWDLVDLSAPKIIGHWLMLPSHLGDKLATMDGLASSDSLWRKRISMVSSWMTSRLEDPSWCLRYAEMHLHHPHDLMHKAVGWMLREMGKQVNMDLLRDFLERHAHEMPRTMLRYAIEKMGDVERQYWMKYSPES